MRDWSFVRVEADVPGLAGLGEATLEFQTRAVVGAIGDLALLITGKDRRNTEHLWQVMYRHPFCKGGIVTPAAASGIDQALQIAMPGISASRSGNCWAVSQAAVDA